MVIELRVRQGVYGEDAKRQPCVLRRLSFTGQDCSYGSNIRVESLTEKQCRCGSNIRVKSLIEKQCRCGSNIRVELNVTPRRQNHPSHRDR